MIFDDLNVLVMTFHNSNKFKFVFVSLEISLLLVKMKKKVTFCAGVNGGMGPTKKLKIAPPQTLEPNAAPKVNVKPKANHQPKTTKIKPRKEPPMGAPPPMLQPEENVSTLPVDPVIRLLNLYFSKPHMELEAKLGRWMESRFESGVSQQVFEHIHTMLDGYKGWSSVKDWYSLTDYFLPNQIRCTKSSEGNSFIRKSVVSHANFQCQGRAHDIRVSLKEEAPVEVRVPGSPEQVRVKKRKSFVYKNSLRYDLTMVWTGVDEYNAQQSTPTFEVELECLDRRALGTDHLYTATSMLEKMIDLIGRPTTLRFVETNKK